MLKWIQLFSMLQICCEGKHIFFISHTFYDSVKVILILTAQLIIDVLNYILSIRNYQKFK